MKKGKRTTIYDIAAKLGITASSVSRALNNSNQVNEKTKELIMKTADELNYKRNVTGLKPA
jgi:LacI family repressor for deo operon, udp, cdd, tsx, nupC, and nupG